MMAMQQGIHIRGFVVGLELLVHPTASYCRVGPGVRAKLAPGKHPPSHACQGIGKTVYKKSTNKALQFEFKQHNGGKKSRKPYMARTEGIM